MSLDHLDMNPTASPCVMVIFGATGDLTKRKLIPALCNLAQDEVLPKQFAIVGFAGNDLDAASFRKMLSGEIPKYVSTPIDPKLWDWMCERIYYVKGDFLDPEAYKRLDQQISEADKKHNTLGNRFFYLAVAPRFFSPIAQMLGQCCLTKEETGHWARVIIEKPFGHDLESAKKLNQELNQVLTEKQIYRIDHYLGKETVQNLMVFRFSNNIIEPLWNRNYVDHVQITAAETVGVEHRGGFYETAGALRDMVPNHLFQLLTMTAMEPPISFGADEVRNKQAEVLHAIQPLDPEDVLKNMVRGQYGPGIVDGQRVAGYRSEPDVAPDSNTETFVALKLQIDNWRWAGVPFYLRTGKRLAKRMTEIVIQFRRTPFVLFRNTTVKNLETNRLVIHIQPDEGISLSFGAKVPRRMACAARARIPQLRGWLLGTHRGRRIARKRRPLVAPAGRRRSRQARTHRRPGTHWHHHLGSARGPRDSNPAGCRRGRQARISGVRPGRSRRGSRERLLHRGPIGRFYPESAL